MSMKQTIDQLTSFDSFLRLLASFIFSCIVVNEISQESSADEIRSYFEDTNISGGGKVEQIIRIYDGHLIVFRDEEYTSAPNI